MSPLSRSPASTADSDRATGFAEGVLRVRHAALRSESPRDGTRDTEVRAAIETTTVVTSPMGARSVHPADLMVLERAARSIRLRTR